MSWTYMHYIKGLTLTLTCRFTEKLCNFFRFSYWLRTIEHAIFTFSCDWKQISIISCQPWLVKESLSPKAPSVVKAEPADLILQTSDKRSSSSPSLSTSTGTAKDLLSLTPTTRKWTPCPQNEKNKTKGGFLLQNYLQYLSIHWHQLPIHSKSREMSTDHFGVKRSERDNVLEKLSANASTSHENHRDLLHPPLFFLKFRLLSVAVLPPLRLTKNANCMSQRFGNARFMSLGYMDGRWWFASRLEVYKWLNIYNGLAKRKTLIIWLGL